LKCEPVLIDGRPIDSPSGLHESATEVLHLVYDLCRACDAAPLNVERYRRRNRSDGRDAQTGKPLSIGEVVQQIVSVRHGNVVHADRGEAAIEVDLNGIVPHWNHPEKTVGRDSGTVVMNLLNDIGRSYRTGVDVESDEHEGTMMVVAIFPNVFALHGSHVSAIR